MEFPLNIPAKKQQPFLDQLNASLRSVSSFSSGSSAIDPMGKYRTNTLSSYGLPSGEATLIFSVVKTATGVLETIEVTPLAGSTPPVSWESDVNRLVQGALASTIAERQQRYFRRNLFYYVGAALDGEYRLGGYRVAPLLTDDDEPTLRNAERVVVVDTYVDAVDDYHATDIAGERARRFAARLSTLAQIGLYMQPSEMRWVMPVSNGDVAVSMRRHVGYFDTGAIPVAMPKKGSACKPGRFAGSLGVVSSRYVDDVLCLSKDACRVLNGIDACGPVVADAFDRCARLFQVSLVCGRQFPSVGFAYRVAAVEAIAQTLNPVVSFSEFIRTNVAARHRLETVLDYLYKRVRSSHFHGGVFPSGEFDRSGFMDPLRDSVTFERIGLEQEGYALIDEAIAAWILTVL